ncbi:MAG: Flp pilus assembly protein CpaB [Hyphomonadaceae bacterium JAD_PAG50586_4]|nr:MAG: Flp pilus assembly protein CpaB [Hyphomonadaceae bacterium JAD_PAG50586_4]
MSARQLIVLGVAALAAVLALILIRGVMGGRQAEPTAAAAPIAGEQVLVLTRDVAQGAALTPSDLGVALFPQGSISQAYVRISSQPSAQADFVGAITRRPFVAGEPITTTSVVQPEGRGAMAALLQPGFRAVAIEIDPETAVGGYIQPNDHVDVLVTHTDNSGGTDQVRSDVVLEDIRILALGDTTQPTNGGEGPTKVVAGVAVLELSAEDARALAMAGELGTVSLALRGVEAETVGMSASNSRHGVSQQSGAVRVHAYGNVVGGN